MEGQDGERVGKAEPDGRPIERLNGIVQTLAILGAGAWAVYTFVYEAKIKPTLAPPTVSVTSALEKSGEQGSRVAIRTTVTRTNVGQTGVRVLGLAYNVIGLRARFHDGPDASGGGAAEREAAFQASLARSATVGLAQDYDRREEGEAVILRQGVLFSGATRQPSEPSGLNPGEAVSRDLVIYADKSRYDSVRLQVNLVYQKEADAPVPLRFARKPNGTLAIEPETDCPPGRCALQVTDFATEFSLW